MNITLILGFCLISASLIALIRQYKPEFAMPMSIAATAIVLIMTLVQSSEVIATVDEIATKSGVNQASIKLLLKALGICYITQLASDSCRDSNETALAGKVDLAGKIAIAVLSLPLIANILDIITKLLL